ncbi:hypothetical protein ACRALDRAFT_1094230 [Sodiomyces alcalophilus JCM 7366]|uniref:uncharacterized protein n=1 Tax=Sodiomyces alcalophilus JCM 7366 TaxID=591952 RepID=UPI0039B55F36
MVARSFTRETFISYPGEASNRPVSRVGPRHLGVRISTLYLGTLQRIFVHHNVLNVLIGSCRLSTLYHAIPSHRITFLVRILPEVTVRGCEVPTEQDSSPTTDHGAGPGAGPRIKGQDSIFTNHATTWFCFKALQECIVIGIRGTHILSVAIQTSYDSYLIAHLNSTSRDHGLWPARSLPWTAVAASFSHNDAHPIYIVSMIMARLTYQNRGRDNGYSHEERPWHLMLPDGSTETTLISHPFDTPKSRLERLGDVQTDSENRSCAWSWPVNFGKGRWKRIKGTGSQTSLSLLFQVQAKNRTPHDLCPPPSIPISYHGPKPIPVQLLASKKQTLKKIPRQWPSFVLVS